MNYRISSARWRVTYAAFNSNNELGGVMFVESLFLFLSENASVDLGRGCQGSSVGSI